MSPSQAMKKNKKQTPPHADDDIISHPDDDITAHRPLKETETDVPQHDHDDAVEDPEADAPEHTGFITSSSTAAVVCTALAGGTLSLMHDVYIC